jgi:hypothetical protein
MPAPSLRCGNCLQFDHGKGVCGWLIPECSGANSEFVSECPLFTNQFGNMPRLDGDEFQQMDLLHDL